MNKKTIKVRDTITGKMVDVEVSQEIYEELQMYRIDGKCEEYRKLKTIIDNKLESKDITIKNEYNIEFSKYYLSQFQYQEAINCVNSISTSSNEIQQIKKAILLIETNKRQEAIEILKQLKSAIIQKKYSENKIASYAPFVNTVQQSMLETRLCLMGFSGDDPNFLSWVGWLRDNLDKSCLSIYLCGVFDDLSVADKKLIEKRGITIIDLSLLVSKDTKNKYLDSYSKFFDLLDSRITQENVSILSTMPKAHKRIIDKLAGKDLEDYNKSVDCYADTVWNYISKYACLPNEESKKLSSFFYNELEYLLSNISIHDIGKYVNKCCYILYYCHCVLYDPEASKLEKIISESNEDNDYIKIYL